MNEETLEHRVQAVRSSLPPHVLLVAAAKTRTAVEVQTAVETGITAIGYNYVQEAEAMSRALKELDGQETSKRVQWHLIGHLQRNKAKKAVEMFDMIETIDSLRIAEAVDRHCADIGKFMPVLVEINSGRESNKTGVPPEGALSLAR